MSSVEYWDKRWVGDVGVFPNESFYDRSWPDRQARWLELRFIADCIFRKIKSIHVLELGCGPFTLSEDNEILYGIHENRPFYTGFDSSEAAIQQGKAAYKTVSLIRMDMSFLPRVKDLRKPNTTILSRRFLQNLTPAERSNGYLDEILSYDHGILVECTISGLCHLNEVRYDVFGIKPVLNVPEFNHYLTEDEEAKILARATPCDFAALYYYLTRGLRNLKDFNTPYHCRAASLSRDFPGEKCYGPLRGFFW